MSCISSISVYCCTWNVGGVSPPRQDFDKLMGVEFEPHPDVVFLGLQEVVASGEWYDALKIVMAPLDYVLIKYRNCWSNWIFAFVKRHLLSTINNIESEMTALGFAGIMGNKGACSIRFEVCGVNMICVSAHFTPHPEKLNDRINDYYDVTKDQRFRDPNVNLLLDHDYVFWMGDLNFRTDGLKKTDVEQLISSKRIDILLEHDQLRNAIKADLVFRDFKEGEITFPPTFKYDMGTTKYDSSKKQRVPSYTDRILFMASNVQLNETDQRLSQEACKQTASSDIAITIKEDFEKNGQVEIPEIRLLAYDHLPDYSTSDHRPVFARFLTSILSPTCPQLPVRFIQPIAPTHPVDKALSFLYVVTESPPFATGGLVDSGSRQLQAQHPGFAPNGLCSHLYHDYLQQSLACVEASSEAKTQQTPDNLVSTERECQSASGKDLELLSHEDWIAVLPVDFYDLWKDDLASILNSSCTLVDPDLTVADQIEDDIKCSDNLTGIPCLRCNKAYTLLKAKVDTSVLQKCRSGAIQLVYFSKSKNCPQGYSEVMKLSRPDSTEQ